MTSSKANIRLEPLTETQLNLIAAEDSPRIAGLCVADGALPPPHVAIRSLKLLAAGCLPEWAVPLNIISVTDGVVVGGCGFKGAPVAGSVEIGYGVAPSFRGRGYASAAIREMLLAVARSSQVTEVVALITPDNIASSSLVARAGFRKGDIIVDSDGENVVRWRWARVA